MQAWQGRKRIGSDKIDEGEEKKNLMLHCQAAQMDVVVLSARCRRG
jgi:hypothetical protein